MSVGDIPKMITYEEMCRRIVLAVTDGIWVVDPQGHTIFNNKRMAEILGADTESLSEQSCFECVFPEDLPEAQRQFAQGMGGKRQPFDFRLRRKDGTAIWVSISCGPVSDASGVVVGLLGLFAEITERKLAEAKIRESEERRVAELAKANAVIRGNLERLAGETDLHSFMGHMLLEATRQFGAISGDVVAAEDSLQEWQVIAHVHDGRLQSPLYAASEPMAGSSFTKRYGGQREPVYTDARDVIVRWPGLQAFHSARGVASSVVYPLMFDNRSVGFMALSFQRRAEEVTRSELLVALAQQATLAVQLTRLAHSAKEAAVLLERTRIGQEIHDGLAQAFTGILLQLGAVEEFPSCRKRGSELAVTLSRIRELARDGLADARRSVMALRLDQTRRAGLGLALRQLAERSTVPGGVRCTFEGGGIETGLKPEHEHELLRIAQEAVSNAVRHARPQLVRITMTNQPAHWELAVADDGVGMGQSPELSARQGFGLASMRQRASAIGGQWQIESAAGRGTRVSVRLLKRAF
jgi:PAS domain S-box-containing protein